MSNPVAFLLAFFTVTTAFAAGLLFRGHRQYQPPPLEPPMPRQFYANPDHPSRRLNDFWEEFNAIEFTSGELHAEVAADDAQREADYGDAHNFDYGPQFGEED
jgi:hypothetical protein